MTRQIDAVYEDGVLKPLAPLDLGENERVHLTITSEPSDPLEDLIDHEFLKTIARELEDLGPVPTHAELRAMLSHDKSSWSDTIIAERQER
jgi:predicted DNA-binding antitoxin AbrB/MazE fold protein